MKKPVQIVVVGMVLFVSGGAQELPPAPPPPAPEPSMVLGLSAVAKLPNEGVPQCKDLGIWPPQETWQLAPEKDDGNDGNSDKRAVETGDP